MQCRVGPYRGYMKFIAAVLTLAVFSICGPAYAEEVINAKDVIQQSPYELGFLAGYGWAMDNHKEQSSIQHAVFMPSFSIPLTGIERGRSFYRGIVQYQLEPVFGVITRPNGKPEVGLSFAGFKYNFTAREDRWLPYSTFGFGVIYEPIGRRVEGSDLNFIIQTGFGVEYFLDKKHAVNVQYRYRHISNAHIKEPNLSINSSFLLVGYSFF